MAQRYIMAMDYADMNARMILKKHAKKRPLGDIETRHRYTPAQPVLSCRTVDIDVSGTRTYRHKSTTDIIQEQHKLIHNLYTKSNRNVISAPNRRPTQQNTNTNQHKFHRINIEVQGRPLTSHPELRSKDRKVSAHRKSKSAEFKENNEYYSIESGVGSRIAQQLQKGDKVRVGINGRVQSGDLRVRQWKKPSMNETIDSKSDRMEKVVIPLCWDDQVAHSCAKVISPRSQQSNKPRPNLCETHPVIFQQEDTDKSRPRLASRESNGYKVKQRPKSHTGLDGQELDNRIVVLSIDQNSNEEDDKLKSLTVDDVLKHSISAKPAPSETSSVSAETKEKSDKVGSTLSQVDSEKVDNPRGNSKTSIAESHISNSELPRTPRMKVVTPTFTVPGYSVTDLSVGPPTGSLSRTPNEVLRSASSSRINCEKSSGSGSYRSERGSAKHIYKSPTSKPVHSSSTASFAMYGTKGETEFIQISTQIKNPNPQNIQPLAQSKPQDLYITQSVSDEAIRQVSKQNMADAVEGKKPTPAPASSPEPPDTDRKSDRQSVTPASLAINIPTAEDFSDRDSIANSPWPSNRVEGEELKLKQKDSQVEQITNMLEETVVELESTTGHKDGSHMSEKSVKFKFDD